MSRILLYSPGVIGHPRVYCRVIADALQGESCEILISMGFSERVGLTDCADLVPLLDRAHIRILDNRIYSATNASNLTAEEIVHLQRKENVDTTLFIEADNSNIEFRRIAAGVAPRLIGRNIGIFANTAEWHPGEDSFTGESKRLIAPTLRTTLGNFKRAIFNRSNTARYFYEHIILGPRILDELLVKDERLAKWRGAPVYWMPEISRAVDPPETIEERRDFERSLAELSSFLNQNAGREPVLYFGDAAYYKGYDLFLRFLDSAPNTCGVHAGRLSDEREKKLLGGPNIDELRARLTSAGRLYERGNYVHTQRLKELYFGIVRVYLTTHRLALSSATMIQAIELGKPVLVPDRGLLKHRVLANGIGAVYRYEDINDLKLKAESLWAQDLTQFETRARAFWERFSDDAVRKFFTSHLLAKS